MKLDPQVGTLGTTRKRTAGRGAPVAGLVLLLHFACAAPARAGSGADLVDDADVETPGVCHVESWVTRFRGDQGLLTLAPACTRKAWPRLEFGGAFQHGWDGGSVTAIGPTLKLNLRPTDSGLGLAVSGAGTWNVRTGEPEAALLVVPVSIPIGRRVQVNLNGGWVYARAAGHPQEAFAGAQIEADVGPNVSLMLEVFDHSRGKAGGQARARWTPGGGRVDFDLLVGRLLDGVTPNALTFGVTVRQ